MSTIRPGGRRRRGFTINQGPNGSIWGTGGLPASNRRFYRRVQKWIDAQVTAGDIRPLSADLYYAFWLGPAQELARQWLAKRSRTKPTDVIEIMSEAAWAALKSEHT